MNNEETKSINAVHTQVAGSATLSPGTTLQSGKYRIERVLGQGGFGITYLATQISLSRKVAIKEFFFKDCCEREVTGSMSISNAQNSELVERFKQKFLKEGRTISGLNHPNIADIHDTFTENDTAYYVMDYIEGNTLDELVKQQGRLTEAVALNYIRQVADALQYLHQRNLCHLDVKPANIMVNGDGKVYLIDFGLSKQYDLQGGQTSTTPVGISHGYAPMEQYNAGGVKTFSPQTDIYSLGATLYKLVTGHTPPQASDVLNDGLPKLPANISSNVGEAITQSMQVKKADRPESIASFLDILNSGVKVHSSTNSQGPTITRVNTTTTTPKSSSSSNVALWIAIFLVAVVVVIIAGIAGHESSDSDNYYQEDAQVEEVAPSEESQIEEVAPSEEVAPAEKVTSAEKKTRVEETAPYVEVPFEEGSLDEEDDIYQVVEKMPRFPGGDAECSKFVSENLHYPTIAQDNGIQGRVILSFVVNKDGSIVDIVVTRGVDPSLDREAVRVVKLMPKWEPGELHGKPVRVRYVLPVMFRLE